jgi:hypothetical protein
MTRDDADPASTTPGDGRSDAALRTLLDNFVQSIKRGEPRDETFHEVMEALLTAGDRLHTSAAAVDPDLMAALQSLRRLKLEEALPADMTKGRKRLVGKRLIGTVSIDRIDSWLDTLRSSLASLLGGDGPHRSLLAYSFYLISNGPGPNTAWYVRLAIQKLEDDKAQGPHEAEALARLGAVEALPALRKAAARFYGSPSDPPQVQRIFDAAIKKPINEAIALLERRAGG